MSVVRCYSAFMQRPLTPGFFFAVTCLLLPLGCRGPNKANIELRKQNQELSATVNRLRADNEQLQADVRRLESQNEMVSTLPSERLEQLWTVADLGFGRLTGTDRRAEGAPLKVYLRPLDRHGSTLKAAGAITVEAFDLDADEVRLGKWEFPLEQAKSLWTSGGLLNEYVLVCPWEGDPPAEGTDLLIKVTFVDALTQRRLQKTKEVK